MNDSHPDHQLQSIPYSRSRQAGEAQAMLDRIRDDFADNPASMDYFYDLFEQVYCLGEPLAHSGPLVGTTCIQIPEELIYALGATPVRLCNGSYFYDNQGADFMPAKSCSLVKATLGMLYSEAPIPRTGPLDLVVNPTTCDQKTKAGALIAAHGHPVYDMELPRSKDSDSARLYWRESVHALVQRLAEQTGHKLTRRGLKQAMARTARARNAFRALHRLRQSQPSCFLGKDAFLVTNAYFFDDIDRWCAALEALNEELAQRRDNGFQAVQKKAPRILFTGSPPVFPNLKLPLLIEESGGVVVADETCSANRMLYDLTAVDEWRLYDMVDAIADRYLKPCTCPIFNHNADRQRRLLELAESFAVDGVVYQSFSGCQVYEMEQRSIADALAERGLPMLYVETDYSPDDMGQLSTRVEAFIESIKSRKRRRG
ncbi:MAG: double-cubane-cluster-containing anaerobic reductase [Candidatus Thiodiazotropha sp.]|jgi:benzoyl-CoA reductase/2-hydroxyglutaryl-CoA dehydratase subunit BcrC/BadD/HgdB